MDEREKALIAIGFLEGLSPSVWNMTGGDGDQYFISDYVAEQYDDSVQTLRGIVLAGKGKGTETESESGEPGVEGDSLQKGAEPGLR